MRRRFQPSLDSLGDRILLSDLPTTMPRIVCPQENPSPPYIIPMPPIVPPGPTIPPPDPSVFVPTEVDINIQDY